MKLIILLCLLVFGTSHILANEPDLSMFDADTRVDIKSECTMTKIKEGIVPYYSCIEKNKSEIISYGYKPDLSMFDANTRVDIKSECTMTKIKEGILPYYDCLIEEAKKIEEFLSLSSIDRPPPGQIFCKREGRIYPKDKEIGCLKYTKQVSINEYCSYLFDKTNIKTNIFNVSIFKDILKKYSNNYIVYNCSEIEKNYVKFGNHICNLDQPIEFIREKALEFYNQEKLEDTFTCSKVGAFLNDPYSIGIMGWHYQSGTGVNKDLVEANKWYRLGVELNDNYSKVNLAKNLREGAGIIIDEKKSFNLVKEAAETGYAIAEADLGFHYLQSIGTPANYDKAFKYFNLAAEKGNIFAQGYLGWMYAGGRGTEKDFDLGFYWTKKAADQNDDFAQANLGWHYHNGFGVKKNYELAEEFYLKASEKGNEYAKDQLSKLKQQKEQEYAEKTKDLREENKWKQELDEILKKSKPIEEEYVAIKNTNIRKRPSIESEKIDLLTKDSVIYVIGQYNDWYIIRKFNQYGFVFSKLLDPKFQNNTEPSVAVFDDLQLIDPPKIIIDNPGKYHALVIGNNKYEYWSRLDAAVNDAQEIGQILESKYDFNVTPLIDADRDEIMNSIYDMREKLTVNDNLLIYFAGHGELDTKAERGYWIPIDGDLNKPTKWISNQYIIDQLKASEAKHIMVITDSCFSASLMRGKTKNNTSNSLNQLSKMKTRIILTSGGLGPVFDGGGENNHSVFASVLIDALLNQKEPFVTGEIFPQIREYVQNNVEPLYVCDDDGNCEEEYQTPEFSVLGKTGHAGGDFIFVPN